MMKGGGASRPLVFRLALAAAATGALAGCGNSNDPVASGTLPADRAPADYQYSIPSGTGDRLDAGEVLELVPSALTMNVGEVIEIVNDDDRGYSFGPFFVGAGETVRHEFDAAGLYEGACGLVSEGTLTITVTP